MALAAGDGKPSTGLPCGDDDKLIKLLATLEEIWNHVESKKDEMDIISRENRKLLKPMPKRLHEKSKSEENEILLDEKGGYKCETTQRAAPSENELAELNLINEALEKAQKAWKKHRHTAEDGASCKVTPEDVVKAQTKAEFGSNPKVPGVTNVEESDDTEIGVISQKELTRALSNVRVSRMKAAYKKAPYKTSDCQRKKIPLSSQTNKSQPKSSSQGTSHSRHSALGNSKHSKDGNSHSSVNSNHSQDVKTHSTVRSLDTNKSSGSFQEKTQNDFKMVKSEENKKKTEFKLDTGANANINSEPLYVIPPSIKDLYQQHHSLRRKIGKVKEHPKNAESFLNLWESKMTKTPNGEAKLLSQKYENLFALLQSLNLPCISDSSSPQEILETKTSLEYILTSMFDLNQQTETLLQKAKSAGVPPQMDPVPQIVPKEIWLPPDLLNSPFYDHLKDSSLKGLHYSRLEELNEYWDQQQKLQECLLSQHFLQIVFECLLPLLKSQHLQQREKLFLYRILRGFLHHNGKQFPTLIDS